MQSESECDFNPYPAKLVGALHTAHLYVSILSSRDNLHTLKVTSQDHNITTGAIGLKKRMKKKCIDKNNCTWLGTKANWATVSKLNQTTENWWISMQTAFLISKFVI